MTLEQVTLRMAESRDARTLFFWRNDPAIVRLGSTQKTVTWNEHANWFERMSDQTRHLVFLIEIDGQDGGMVRLDRTDESQASISTFLLPQFTGRGLGPKAIHMACRTGAARWHPRLRVQAAIRAENKISVRAFKRAGFQSGFQPMDDSPDHTVLMWQSADAA